MQKKNRRNKKIGVRVAAAVLAVAIIAPMPGIFRTTAAAATSLSGIEQIKNRGSFSILEIVPQEGTGSIGYYVGGQEPTANWLDELAAKVGKSERKAYADQLLADLKATGLMGDVGASVTTYPIVKTGDYQEYLPWETMPSGADYEELQLDKMEEQKVKASFQTDTSGDYIQANTYIFDANGGDYVENALHYVYNERGGAAADSTYYYCVAFTRVEITEANVNSYIGVPLYTPVTSTTIPGHTYYEYAGTLKVGGDFTIDDDINDPVDGIGYFTATIATGHEQPTSNWECLREVAAADVAGKIGKTLYIPEADTYTAVVITEGYVPVEGAIYYELVENAHSYYAYTDPSAPYRLKATGEVGYFDQVIGYQFVGNGNAPYGATYYKLVADANGTEQNIAYNTVYFTGGYTNNNWFKRYVLDIEEANLDSHRVTVNSVTPDMMTETMIRNAGMVVVSAGFNRATGAPVAYTMDINAGLLTDLYAKPRVVDTRITGAPNLLSAQDGAVAPVVTANNVYNFAAGTGADARTALATNQFHTAFTDTAPYQVVVDEIEYENFLRDGENLLSEDISMATCIRYIINTHRIQNKKTSLNVLDIQPAAKYDGASGPLTVATVKSWLPEATKTLIGDNINITHMSTAALVGKIEDMSEKYDLIYIGAAEKGNNLPDNMYYANIGKTQTVDGHLRGLLKNGSTLEGTARYSGNDLTPKKQRELLEFANAGLPIVVSDTLVSGGTVSNGPQLRAEITTNGNSLVASYTLNPAPAEGSSVSVEYQWQRRNRTSISSNYQNISGQTSDTLLNPSTSNYYYRCCVIVTIDGVDRVAYTQGVRYSTSGGGGNSGYYEREFVKHTGNYSEWDIEYSRGAEGNSTYEFEIDPNATSQKLGVSYDRDYVQRENVSYRWYRVGSNTRRGTDDEYQFSNTDINNGNYYYCVITCEFRMSRRGTWYTVTATSPAYKLTQTYVSGGNTGTGSITQVDQAVIPNPFPGVTTSGNTLDTTKVDPCSLLYDALHSVWNRENVFVESEVKKTGTSSGGNTTLDDNQDTLVKYLNLSRPSIVITAKPKDYGGVVNTSANDDCNGALNFNFSIQNATDPTPLQTRYQCNVYIDQNGDGRHTEDERIGDIYLGEVSGSNTTAVNNGELKSGPVYSLQRTLNRAQFHGLVAWKLEVVKVGDSTVHASEKGYAYIKPDVPTVINVLQVRSGNGEGVNLKTDGDFPGLYGQLKTANMYDIKVDVVSVNDLKNRTNYPNTAAVFAKFDDYDMIMLGFADCYGDLDDVAAEAVVQYIETGKAILFTHDTTSFYNETKSQAQSRGIYIYKHWGYYFNQIIRDKVGLDRYGVTNSTFKNMGINEGADNKITSDEAQSLRNAGYTPAYVPGSAKQSAGSTQGYTDLNIYNYGSDSGEKLTNTVSQVNRGSITEYPFRISSTLTVDQTHQQYYQLNMNADDIVVWYCLSGNGGSGNYNYNANHYNDVTNAYYIFNRGNITYSGAGHKATLSADEAKLFVNTMIAAYRAAYSKPTIEFKTADDYPASMQLVPVEFESATSSQSLGGVQNIYFKLQDTNLTANKSIAVELYYDVAEGTSGAVVDDVLTVPGEGSTAPRVKKATLGKVYRVDTGAEVTATNLSSNILYRTTIPTEALTYFASQPDVETRIYLKATTTIHNGSSNSSYSGSDDLTLKKLGLLRLE